MGSARFDDWFPPELDHLEREGLDLLLEAVREQRVELERELGGPFDAEVDDLGRVELRPTAGGPSSGVERHRDGRLVVTRPPDPEGRL